MYFSTVYCKKITQTKEWSDGHMLLSLPYLRTFLQRIVIISIDFFHGYVDQHIIKEIERLITLRAATNIRVQGIMFIATVWPTRTKFLPTQNILHCHYCPKTLNDSKVPPSSINTVNVFTVLLPLPILSKHECCCASRQLVLFIQKNTYKKSLQNYLELCVTARCC